MEEELGFSVNIARVYLPEELPLLDEDSLRRLLLDFSFSFSFLSEGLSSSLPLFELLK